jgi:hypothetical protein
MAEYGPRLLSQPHKSRKSQLSYQSRRQNPLVRTLASARQTPTETSWGIQPRHKVGEYGGREDGFASVNVRQSTTRADVLGVFYRCDNGLPAKVGARHRRAGKNLDGALK